MFCCLPLLGVQNILVLISIILRKKKKKGKSQYIASEDNILFVLTSKSSDFPFTPFSLENKEISETCSNMDRKTLLKVGLEVKLVNLELS